MAESSVRFRLHPLPRRGGIRGSCLRLRSRDKHRSPGLRRRLVVGWPPMSLPVRSAPHRGCPVAPCAHRSRGGCALPRPCPPHAGAGARLSRADVRAARAAHPRGRRLRTGVRRGAARCGPPHRPRTAPERIGGVPRHQRPREQARERGGPARPRLRPRLRGERTLLRLLQRCVAAPVGAVAVRNRRRQAGRPRLRVRAARSGPAVPQPQRRHDRVRAGRHALRCAGRRRLGGRPATARTEPRHAARDHPPHRRNEQEGGAPYAIPSDNPFAGQSGARGEIWAYGLRNAWRFSFDRETGDLWTGDVGQNALEEIDVVRRGGNYGWNEMEGSRCFRPACDPGAFEPPVAEYGRDSGCSITGGYVYRGQRLPDLRGVYLYADFCSGRIWGLRYDGERVTEQAQLARAEFQVPSFGEDEAGEVYVLGFDGGIYTFAGPPGQATPDSRTHADGDRCTQSTPPVHPVPAPPLAARGSDTPSPTPTRAPTHSRRRHRSLQAARTCPRCQAAPTEARGLFRRCSS